MTIKTSDHIIAAVPIGEGNAVTPRQIAITYGIGAESTWGMKLRGLLDACAFGRVGDITVTGGEIADEIGADGNYNDG